MIKIAPSILSADFARLGDEIKAIDQAGADYVHIDVMDGHFVPNITIGPLIVDAIRPMTELPLDVHLMIENPDQYIPKFVEAGADIIVVHAEAVRHLHRTIQLIKSSGKKAGVSLNPATSLAALDIILPDLDLVLLMTVNPGFGGQSFIQNSLSKITELRRRINALGLPIDLEVDGGVKIDNIEQIAAAGADVFVAGSAVFGADDYMSAISRLKENAALGQV